jgi:hypothetical protein
LIGRIDVKAPWALGATFVLAVIIAACAGGHQAALRVPQAKPVVIAPRYAPGSTLYFAVQVRNTVNGQPESETAAEVDIHILSSAGPDDYLVAAHFSKYAVTATSMVPDVRAQIQAEAGQETKEALALPEIRFHLLHNHVSIVSRPRGGNTIKR